MYSQHEIKVKVDEWMNTAAAREYLRKKGYGIYSVAEMKAAASKLQQRIMSGFKRVARVPGFLSNEIATVSIDEKKNTVTLTYDPGALHRDSLLRPNGSPSADGGVDDIFAMFTTGWHADGGYTYGIWPNARYNRGKVIRSCKDHEGSDFISAAVQSVEQEYIGLKINYPSAWGG